MSDCKERGHDNYGKEEFLRLEKHTRNKRTTLARISPNNINERMKKKNTPGNGVTGKGNQN